MCAELLPVSRNLHFKVDDLAIFERKGFKVWERPVRLNHFI